MSETVKIGIVGIGNMGSAHAKSILAGNIQGMELAAVCDIAESKRLWAAEKPAGRPVLHRLQGDDRQRPCARRSSSRRRTTCIPRSRSTALKRACTCSPKSRPASTPKQVEEMNEGRREIRQGLRHHVQPAQRTPKFQKMREIVQSGALGELKRCVWIITNWYRTQAYYDSGTWRATWAGEGGGRTDQPVPAQPRPVAVDLRHTEQDQRALQVRPLAQHRGRGRGDGLRRIPRTARPACSSRRPASAPGTNRLEISGDKGKLVWEDGKLTHWALETPEREFCFTCQEGFAQPKMTVTEIETENVELGHNGILQTLR